MKNPSSTINSVLGWLGRRGYSIEYGEVFDEDESAQRALRVYEEYWHTVCEPLMHRFVPRQVGVASSQLAKLEAEHYELLKHETAKFFSQHT